ncbi:MAG: abortive infection family protein [Deltaproteobacteria bacterium]|nr:abortive infection family protein [Deltaproteobacteria bacterium]
MRSADKIIHILTYRNRPKLAQALRGTRYDLNESSTYGSRWYSRLTTVEVYAPIHQYDQLQKLSDEEKAEIIGAFQVVYPVRDNDVEINWIEFFVDPEAPIPTPSRQISRLKEIDFVYITEQVAKCDGKIASADFEGAITNARNLLESMCKYILDDANELYDEKADLPELYRQTCQILNMHPSQHAEKSFKQVLSGCFGIVHGIAAIRNELSDAHGKSKTRHYKPDERHAMFAVGVAKSLAEFIFSSYMENTKKASN